MEERHALQEALEELGGEYSIRSYSGLGMYGKVCLGVVIGRYSMDPFMIGFALAKTEALEGVEDLPRMCSDSMGRDTIYYWPDVPYVGDDDEGEE